MLEIKAWLETKGYSFGSDWHGHYAYIENDEVSISWGGSHAEILRDCLTHWLEGELGRKWHIIWGAHLWKFFDSGDVAEIEQAIKWHEELDENQD